MQQFYRLIHWYGPQQTTYKQDKTPWWGESNQLAASGENAGPPFQRFCPFSDCSCTERPDIFSPAAQNDWVQDASPDVISSNVCGTDLSQTLGLAYCCHMDHLIPWIYLPKTKSSDMSYTISILAAFPLQKLQVTECIRDITATHILDF